MADQASVTFLQDNLLSEDDWGGGLGFADLNDLTSSYQSSPCDDFYLGEEARYEEEYSNRTKNNEEEGFLSFDSPSPLLPPPTNDCNLVDELLQDLLQSKEQQNVTDDALLRQGRFEQRRLSTHTSSSSAYSSCSDSGTPSPVDQFSDHGSCSSVEFHDQASFTVDLTATSDSDINPGSSVAQTFSRHQKHNSSSEHTMKSNQYKHSDLSNDLMKASELENAVRQACEETNRLLKLHKQLSGKAEAEIASEKNKHQASKGQDILKSLCEKTILSNEKRASTPNPTQLQLPVKKPSKRKASTLQDAIDRLQFANKTLCIGTTGLTQPTPFSRSAIVSNPSRAKTTPKAVHLEPKQKEPCIIVTSSQPPLQLQRNVSLENLMLNNGAQTYNIMPTAASASQPLQFYIKQEPPTIPSCQVVGNMYQQQSLQNLVSVCNQKVIVSNGHASNLGLNSPGVSVVKPEHVLCNNGQTIVIQQPAQNQSPQPVLKPVNISEMNAGTQSMVLTQSDLSRLAAQGVIKFPATQKTDRCLVPVSDDCKSQSKGDVKQVSAIPKNQAIFPPVCDVLPTDAVGVINGTSVFVSGLDSHPQHGQLDIKALKRHQRMIKNRASACESRQRRKEYLKTLEDQVTEVAEENKILSEKNEFLSSRVHELEIENKNLRDLVSVRQSQQKKTACALMLVLFIGVNFFQTGLFGTGTDPLQSDSNSFKVSLDNNLKSAVSQESFHHNGRHLLSVAEDDSIANGKKDNETKSNSGLIISEKQTYWMDDLVQQYKDKHLQNFLKLLSETTSNSVKRMLRRKLKEELGITIPLPVPRSRRIAYTPQFGRHRMTKMKDNSKSSAPKLDAIPSTVPVAEEPAVKIPPSLLKPCDQPSIDESALNETEASRVSEDITQWAKRYTVERQEKAQKTAEKRKHVAKKLRNTKSPSSRYEDYDNTTELAVYSRPSIRYNDFLNAINRKNDTLYVFTLNKDHLLLPATERNTSSRMKMALIMPAITSSNRQTHVDYETMIEIECEVINTRMFELKRADVPDFLDVAPVKGTVKTLETASNSTLSEPSNTSSQSAKISQNERGHREYRVDETEKLDEEQDAVVAVVSDVMEPELYQIPPT